VRPEPVLLLHGQPGGARDWDRVRDAIGTRAMTIAIDRPGWDGRGPTRDLQDNAEAALATLDAHGLARATVVGHSFGAAVAAWLAAVNPERVGALVLVAPTANVASLYRLDHLLAIPVLGHVVAGAAFSSLGLALTCGPVRRRASRLTSLDDRYLRSAGRVLLAPAAWRAFAVEQRMLVRQLPSLEARLGQISAPTTVVAGTADRIVPVSSVRRLAGQVGGSELVLLDRAGHLVPQRHAQELAEVIVASIAGARDG
jgi:pimeloyl-ACP methyl ester carboxylesterase